MADRTTDFDQSAAAVTDNTFQADQQRVPLADRRSGSTQGHTRLDQHPSASTRYDAQGGGEGSVLGTVDNNIGRPMAAPVSSSLTSINNHIFYPA